MLILYVLVSLPDHFEGQWPCLASSPVSAPKRIWNRSETTLKHLPAHHLRLYALSVTASLLYIALLVCRKDVLILYVLVSLPDQFEGQWPCLSSASFPEKGKAPWAPQKWSETSLKPLWNTFRLTISDSMLFRLQHRCFWFCIFWCYCRTIWKGNGRV